MRTILFLLRKEFKQIFRNKSILPLIFVMPVVQLLILPLAADYEIKNINLVVVDHDHSTLSRRMINDITGSGYFRLVEDVESYKAGLEFIESDRADLVLEIPAGMERNLMRENMQKIFVAVNAINGTKANLGGAYILNILKNTNENYVAETRGIPNAAIQITASNKFNPMLNYRYFMVPGILAILVTMIGGFLSALNIVREKEVGTMEQINVTPIHKYHFIIGKLLPFLILGNVVFSIGLLASWLVYGIEPAGNLLVLYAFISVYLIAILGFGLLVSTFCDTQQQAMFIMFFFMMVFILLGGLFTSIDSMPAWAQVIARFNPVTYLIEVMRMVILKGSGFRNILPQLGTIAIFGVVLNIWAIMNYRKTS
ncbi:MAG: ABC transporter permease [Bacteroidetes bacterium]|nr:ABC transporter permease [Bacteroidota bacterium]